MRFCVCVLYRVGDCEDKNSRALGGWKADTKHVGLFLEWPIFLVCKWWEIPRTFSAIIRTAKKTGAVGFPSSPCSHEHLWDMDFIDWSPHFEETEPQQAWSSCWHAMWFPELSSLPEGKSVSYWEEMHTAGGMGPVPRKGGVVRQQEKGACIHYHSIPSICVRQRHDITHSHPMFIQVTHVSVLHILEFLCSWEDRHFMKLFYCVSW